MFIPLYLYFAFFSVNILWESPTWQSISRLKQPVTLCKFVKICLWPVIDEHGVGGGAVLGQLPVARTGGDHGQLDGIEGVTGQHLSVEPRVDHRGL